MSSLHKLIHVLVLSASVFMFGFVFGAGLVSAAPKATKPNPSKITEVTEKTFVKEVGNSNLPVLVEYYIPGSRRSNFQESTLQAIAKEYAGKVKVVKVDQVKNEKLVRGSWLMQQDPAFGMYNKACGYWNVYAGGKSESELKEIVENGINACSSQTKP